MDRNLKGASQQPQGWHSSAVYAVHFYVYTFEQHIIQHTLKSLFFACFSDKLVDFVVTFFSVASFSGHEGARRCLPPNLPSGTRCPAEGHQGNGRGRKQGKIDG